MSTAWHGKSKVQIKLEETHTWECVRLVRNRKSIHDEKYEGPNVSGDCK